MHCLGEVLPGLPMVQKMTAASQCTCETTDDATSKFCSLQCVTLWWPRQLHKYLSKIVWGEKHLTVQANSATVLESQKTKIVTDQTLRCWATSLLQTESYGSDRCFTTREKSRAIFKQEANAPNPGIYALSWRHTIWHFVVAFSHLPQPLPLKIEYLGSFLESAVRKGSPGSTTFFYLYQQHCCTSSNIFYI